MLEVVDSNGRNDAGGPVRWGGDDYAGEDRKSPGLFTQGGYSRFIVTDEHFVHRIPDGLDPAGAAPLLCAGITTYSPLRHWGVGPGQKSASWASAGWGTWA